METQSQMQTEIKEENKELKALEQEVQQLKEEQHEASPAPQPISTYNPESLFQKRKPSLYMLSSAGFFAVAGVLCILSGSGQLWLDAGIILLITGGGLFVLNFIKLF